MPRSSSPIGAANVLAGQELYRWIHVSIDGRPVRASNGASVVADQAVGQPLACDTLFVFAAGDPARSPGRGHLRVAARVARHGRLAGVSGGPFLLAHAGLLDKHRATIHWDHRPTFAETFAEISVEPSLYVIDRRRVTCAGGTSGLDLAIELIEREQGHALATRVGDWFIHTESRAADQPQRASLRERYGVANDRVLKVLARMEATVEEPAPLHVGGRRRRVASAVGAAVRRPLGERVNDCYRRIRLDQADQLLRKTGLSITSVAIACGFRSSSHFSRAYRSRYGKTPSSQRRLG